MVPWFHDFSSQRRAVQSWDYEVKGGGHTVVYEHSVDSYQKTLSVYKGDCGTGDLSFSRTFPTFETCSSVGFCSSLLSTARRIDLLFRALFKSQSVRSLSPVQALPNNMR